MTNNSSILHWEDRISAKNKIIEWLSSESKLFTLSVEDTQEIEDIFRWFLKEAHNDTTIIKITLSPDTEILKYGVLEDIAIDIGKENFPLFYQELNRIETFKDSLTVSQTVGHEAKFKKDAQFQNIEQTINIHMNQDEISLHYIYETKINRLLGEFISDINNLIDKNIFIFVFRFVGKGFSAISNDFQQWFQNYFSYRIQKIRGIKTCILSQCKLSSFDIVDQQFFEMLLHLEYDDIVRATCNRIEHNDEFCNGVIDPDTNTIDYKTFVRKWRSRLKKEVKKTNA